MTKENSFYQFIFGKKMSFWCFGILTEKKEEKRRKFDFSTICVFAFWKFFSNGSFIVKNSQFCHFILLFKFSFFYLFDNFLLIKKNKNNIKITKTKLIKMVKTRKTFFIFFDKRHFQKRGNLKQFFFSKENFKQF